MDSMGKLGELAGLLAAKARRGAKTKRPSVSDGSDGLTWDEIPLTAAELKDAKLCPISGGATGAL
ncbi:hypothetical protein ACWGI8_43765 [Streptomyces sp. NPDC054841]